MQKILSQNGEHNNFIPYLCRNLVCQLITNTVDAFEAFVELFERGIVIFILSMKFRDVRDFKLKGLV